MADQDLIQRLLDVEHRADSLVKEAELEAERRKSAAREAQSVRYQEEVVRKTRELDEKLQIDIRAIRNEREQTLEAYMNTLQTTRLTPERFHAAVDSLLGKGIV